jgi:hypothetical protein
MIDRSSPLSFPNRKRPRGLYTRHC